MVSLERETETEERGEKKKKEREKKKKRETNIPLYKDVVVDHYDVPALRADAQPVLRCTSQQCEY